MCPSLQLVDQDTGRGRGGLGADRPAARGLGLRDRDGKLGCAYFETRGVERLYGGLEPALKRALTAVGPGWDARVGAAKRRFAALAAANVARPGQVLVVSDEHAREFLAPLPLTLLPLEAGRREELRELGITKVGELAGLPGGAVAERLGPDGRRAWSLARGGSSRRVRGGSPPRSWWRRSSSRRRSGTS